MLGTPTSVSQAEIDELSLSLGLQLRTRLQARVRTSSSRAGSGSSDARAPASRFSHASGSASVTTIEKDDGLEQLLNSVRSVNAEIDRYEDPYLRGLALDLIPFDQLHERAETLLQKSEAAFEGSLAFQDCLLQALVEWAKVDFLKWADPIKCSACGGSTEGVGSDTPTLSERQEGGAGRVELYACLTCSSQTRFPRYSRLEKLLETRTGRCGEFAAIFMLLLRALSLRARYIWNSEDHVWNEYYSDHLRRWVHVDSCEGARDKHLLYDVGWGKKMRYCLAFGMGGAVDVTRAYVSEWQDTLKTRESRWEEPLRQTLRDITEDRRRTLSQEDRQSLEKEDVSEEGWLADGQGRKEAAERETMFGRTSGTKEWRAQRSELGKGGVAQKKLKPLKLVANHDSQLTYNGSASQADGKIQLTPNTPDRTGSIGFTLPSELQTFIIDFSFHITGSGADGMAVVLHSGLPTALGRGGCDLGYGGIANSVALEIDTYRSQDRCDDPPTPHLSIHSRGKQPNEARHRSSLWCSSDIPDVADGRLYSVRLEVADLKEMRVYLSDSKEDDFLQLGRVDIPDFKGEDGSLCLSFTASTGGLAQEHVVERFEVWEAAVDIEKDSLE